MNKFVMLTLLILFSISFAQTTTGSDRIKKAICDVYKIVDGVLPVMAFVLFVLAGVAYAAGNFFGAEMRAKATGWAMNMITGAIIALILSAIGPTILTSLYGSTVGSSLCPI
ncbi:MAG: hypothetical protein N3G74_01275 [Candidatus Micrarchaeota archaeon]|nr:hypothetical protein [Candidatus Micrarchaeota archaeon]